MGAKAGPGTWGGAVAPDASFDAVGVGVGGGAPSFPTHTRP
jgi:hypothetical protein